MMSRQMCVSLQDGQPAVECSGVTHDTAVTILLVSGCNLTVIVSVASVVTVARDR